MMSAGDVELAPLERPSSSYKNSPNSTTRNHGNQPTSVNPINRTRTAGEYKYSGVNPSSDYSDLPSDNSEEEYKVEKRDIPSPPGACHIA
jgi:hypothetical protein